jgi:hypothetical protein
MEDTRNCVSSSRRLKVSVGRPLSNGKATNDFNNKASYFSMDCSKKMSKASCLEGSLFSLQGS